MAATGSRTTPLLMLLAVLAGAGGWNYHRNLEVERQEHRPFREYTDVELDKLVEAYRSETGALTVRFERATGRKIQVVDHALLGEKVSEFERVQRLSRSTRAIIDELAKMQVQLDLLQAEQSRRIADAGALGPHLARLTRLP
jgi:hypothetical protein